MNGMETVREAARRTGVSLITIGPSIGRSKTYVSAKITNGTDPGAGTLAAMLEPCGHVLCVLPRSDVPASAMVIDPR